MIKKFLDIPRLITGIAFLLIFWVNANAQTLYTDYTPDYKTDYKAYILDKIELVGEDGKALFFIDKDLAAMAKAESTSVMDSQA